MYCCNLKALKNMGSIQKKDEKFIKHCIQLSYQSIQKDNKPFGCLIEKSNKIIAESINRSKQDITYHAEILAIKKAKKILETDNLSACTLYSNCEPCPMCAFIIRGSKIRRVVFALRSPFMGGFTKWNILQDREISQFKPFFSKPPIVKSGVCEKEAALVFNEIGWRMYHK